MAVLPGQSTFTLSFTSAKFDSAMFSMANAIKQKKENDDDHVWEDEATYLMPYFEHVTLTNGVSSKLTHKPVSGSVRIHGLEETTEQTVATGKFKVDYDEQTITVSSDDDFSDVTKLDVVYEYQTAVTSTVITNREAAIGDAVAVWPVYGSGDDCSQSSIIGYFFVEVFRARITQVPGINEMSSPLVQQCTMQNSLNTEKLLAA